MRVAALALAVLTILTAPVRGGNDQIPLSRSYAEKHAHMAAPVAWEVPAHYEAADLIELVGKNRLLVGSLSVGQKYGVPRHDLLYLHDSRTGEVLWKAKRASRPEGEYRLVTTTPNIVMTGFQGKEMEIFALDPASGKSRWRVKSTHPATVRAAGGQVLLHSRAKGVLRAISPRTGKDVWSRSVDTVSPPRVHVSGSLLVLLGRQVVGLSLRTGRERWKLDHPSFTEATAALPFEGDLLLWNSRTLLRVDPRRGTVRWESPAPKEGIKGVYPGPETLLRLASTGAPPFDLPENSGSDRIQLLDPETGSVRWSKETTTTVISPLVATDGAVFFSQDMSFRALELEDGSPRFEVVPHENFAWGSPLRQRLLGLPDQILVRKGGVVLYRLMNGLIGLDTSDGSVRWKQDHYATVHEFDSQDAMYELTKYGELPESARGSGGVARYERTGPNQFLQAAVRSHQEVMSRTSRVLSSSRASSLDRKAAIQDRQLSTSRVMVHQQIDASFGRMEAAMGLADAISNLKNVILQHRAQRMIQGVVQRSMMKGRSILRVHENRFQGEHFLEPWDAGLPGTGITLVELDTGKRADWISQPWVGAMAEFCELGYALRLDPARRRVYAFGVSMDPRKWEKRRRWRAIIPRPSLMAFDVGRMRFRDEKVSLQPGN